MKTEWQGGIMLPPPGENAYGAYEILGDDDEAVGTLVVHNNGGIGKPFKISITTDREIDLEASTLRFVGDLPKKADPFWLDADSSTVYRTHPDNPPGAELHEQFVFTYLSDAQREEVVRLLNNGRHFDRLLAAAKGVLDLPWDGGLNRTLRFNDPLSREVSRAVAEAMGLPGGHYPPCPDEESPEGETDD